MSIFKTTSKPVPVPMLDPKYTPVGTEDPSILWQGAWQGGLLQIGYKLDQQPELHQCNTPHCKWEGVKFVRLIFEFTSVDYCQQGIIQIPEYCNFADAIDACMEQLTELVTVGRNKVAQKELENYNEQGRPLN